MARVRNREGRALLACPVLLNVMRRCCGAAGAVNGVKAPWLGKTVTMTIHDLRIINPRRSQQRRKHDCDHVCHRNPPIWRESHAPAIVPKGGLCGHLFLTQLRARISRSGLCESVACFTNTSSK